MTDEWNARVAVEFVGGGVRMAVAPNGAYHLMTGQTVWPLLPGKLWAAGNTGNFIVTANGIFFPVPVKKLPPAAVAAFESGNLEMAAAIARAAIGAAPQPAPQPPTDWMQKIRNTPAAELDNMILDLRKHMHALASEATAAKKRLSEVPIPTPYAGAPPSATADVAGPATMPARRDSDGFHERRYAAFRQSEEFTDDDAELDPVAVDALRRQQKAARAASPNSLDLYNKAKRAFAVCEVVTPSPEKMQSLIELHRAYETVLPNVASLANLHPQVFCTCDGCKAIRSPANNISAMTSMERRQFYDRTRKSHTQFCEYHKIGQRTAAGLLMTRLPRRPEYRKRGPDDGAAGAKRARGEVDVIEIL